MFIDEFEKVYTKDEQQTLLSLMDGNFETKIVFLLTCNDFRINEFLVNRPGRIRYNKQYEDLDISVINDVIEDLLLDKQYAESIHQFLEKINMSTMDLLVTIIKEVNTFNENALMCAKHLNLEITTSYYDVTQIFPNGNRYKHSMIKIDFTVDDEYEIWRSEVPKEDKNQSKYIFFNPTEWNINNVSRNIKHGTPKVKGKTNYELEFAKSTKSRLVF
jgi:hypothetical protein